MQNFNDFINYVLDFYGQNGIYDQGRTKEQNKHACMLVQVYTHACTLTCMRILCIHARARSHAPQRQWMNEATNNHRYSKGKRFAVWSVNKYLTVWTTIILYFQRAAVWGCGLNYFQRAAVLRFDGLNKSLTVWTKLLLRSCGLTVWTGLLSKGMRFDGSTVW